MEQLLIVRKGDLFDIAAVKHCIEESYASYTPRIGKRPASMDTDFEPLLREGRVWVLEYDRTVVGLMVLIEEPDSFEIRSVAVLPEHQRRGFGRRLMAHAEQLARETGCSTLRLYTNAKLPELGAYYSELGYREEARKQDRGYDRVFMVKILPSIDSTGGMNPVPGDIMAALLKTPPAPAGDKSTRKAIRKNTKKKARPR